MNATHPPQALPEPVEGVLQFLRAKDTQDGRNVRCEPAGGPLPGQGYILLHQGHASHVHAASDAEGGLVVIHPATGFREAVDTLHGAEWWEVIRDPVEIPEQPAPVVLAECHGQPFAVMEGGIVTVHLELCLTEAELLAFVEQARRRGVSPEQHLRECALEWKGGQAA